MNSWTLMTHIYSMWTILIVLCNLVLLLTIWATLPEKKNFFARLNNRGKWYTVNHWWLTHTLCAENWCFLRNFVLVVTYRAIFTKKFFSGIFYLKRKKVMFKWSLMTQKHLISAKLTFCAVSLCWFSQLEHIFPKKLFSRTCRLRGKIDVLLTFDYSYIFYLSKVNEGNYP